MDPLLMPAAAAPTDVSVKDDLPLSQRGAAAVWPLEKGPRSIHLFLSSPPHNCLNLKSSWLQIAGRQRGGAPLPYMKLWHMPPAWSLCHGMLRVPVIC